MTKQDKSEAMTGLEIIIAIAVLCIFIYLFGNVIFNALMPDFSGSHGDNGGIVGFALGESNDLIVVDGTTYGAQDISGIFLSINLYSDNQKSKDMGSCAIPIKILTGQTAAVDMNKAKMIFKYNGITEELSYSEDDPLKSPSWTIADKSNIIPLASADSDIILEPNEIFTIIAYPQTDVPAYGKFSVTIAPEAEIPHVVDLQVPPQITENRIVELYV